MICTVISISMAMVALSPPPFPLSSIFIPPAKRGVPTEMILCYSSSRLFSLSNVRRAAIGCSSLFRLITRLFSFLFLWQLTSKSQHSLVLSEPFPILNLLIILWFKANQFHCHYTDISVTQLIQRITPALLVSPFRLIPSVLHLYPKDWVCYCFCLPFFFLFMYLFMLLNLLINVFCLCNLFNY